ncbi:MAG: T9SS type A sorting domain-containing protein [Bacteroidetes bacterium]|nr:T9SS type A sorting domain-containing protein [Bacteroidota bacterium]
MSPFINSSVFKTLLVVTLLIQFNRTSAQLSSITKNFGGGNNDYAYNSTVTKDGDVIIVGSTESFGSGTLDTSDNYILKLDRSGNVLWSKTVGSASLEELYWVESTEDSAFVVCGTIRKLPNFPNELEVFKIDDSGNVLWKKRYTITGSEVAHCIRSVPGGFLLICETDNGTDYDFAVIRLDLNGDVLWNHTYGTNEFDIPIHAERTSDGGYLIGGNSRVGNYYSSVYLVKIDSIGNFLWSKKYNTSPAFSKCSLSRVLETQDHGFIIAGATNADNLVINDALLIRTDSVGNMRWIYTYGEQGDDHAFDMKILQDGTYLFCGSTSSVDITGLNDMMLMQVDTSGNLIGNWAWGNAGQEEDAYSFELLENSVVMLSGITDYSVTGWFDIAVEISSLDPGGNCNQLNPVFRRLPSTINIISGPTVADTLIINVSSLPLPENHGSADTTICSTLMNVNDLDFSLTGSVYPNPVTNALYYNFDNSFTNNPAQFILTDVHGEIVLVHDITGVPNGKIQLKGLSNGIYFGRINCGALSWQGKIIIMD